MVAMNTLNSLYEIECGDQRRLLLHSPMRVNQLIYMKHSGPEYYFEKGS